LRRQLAGVLAVGALARVACVAFAARLPIFHRLDAAIYHHAGRAIAGGELLGRGPFHLSPLYFYFVAAAYRLFGDGRWPITIVQSLLGLATVALVTLSCRRLYGAKWAWAGGIGAALYGPFLFYELQLDPATLATALHALVLWAALAGDRWRLTGFAWGLAILTRPNAVFLGVPLALAARRKMAALVGVAALTVAPATVRNLVVAHELVWVTDSGGFNFWLGNGPEASGTFFVPRALPGADTQRGQVAAFHDEAQRLSGRPLTFREADSFWWRRTLGSMAANPGRWLAVTAEKAWLFVAARELPNIVDYDFARRVNPALRMPWLQFGALIPFAILGTAVALARRRHDWLPAAFNVAGAASVVAFFVLSRYRVPVVPSLLVSAVGCVRLLTEHARTRRLVRVWQYVAALSLLAALAFFARVPKPFDDPAFNLPEEWFKLGFAYQAGGHAAEAERSYRAALAADPGHRGARLNLATLCEQSGRAAEAAELRPSP
jgi:4-amino-4-deoxy-L-arabinose transferase-like glycosyltransferase